ncbi:hypothetical protein ACOMHN_029992 [Nucella lapillus]
MSAIESHRLLSVGLPLGKLWACLWQLRIEVRAAHQRHWIFGLEGGGQKSAEGYENKFQTDFDSHTPCYSGTT